MSAVFEDGGENHNGGRVGLLMGKRGSYSPSTNCERNRCFLVALYSLILRRPNLEVEVQNQEVFLSAGKNTEIVLVPCPTWKCVSTAISGGIDISEVLGCHLLQQMSSQ